MASAWSSSMRSWSFCRRLRRASQARVPAAKSGDAAEATNPVSSIVPAAMPVRPEWVVPPPSRARVARAVAPACWSGCAAAGDGSEHGGRDHGAVGGLGVRLALGGRGAGTRGERGGDAVGRHLTSQRGLRGGAEAAAGGSAWAVGAAGTGRPAIVLGAATSSMKKSSRALSWAALNAQAPGDGLGVAPVEVALDASHAVLGGLAGRGRVTGASAVPELDARPRLVPALPVRLTRPLRAASLQLPHRQTQRARDALEAPGPGARHAVLDPGHRHSGTGPVAGLPPQLLLAELGRPGFTKLPDHLTQRLRRVLHGLGI